MYVDMFSSLDQKEFFKVIDEMFEQKKKIGLINSDWEKPKFKKIIPVLIISNYKKSTSKEKFKDVLDISRKKLGDDFLKDLKCFKYTSEEGLTKW
jgi:anaerobic ribonucleoside-triphosphate reductase